MPEMKRKKLVIVTSLVMLFVYTTLGAFNLLYWSPLEEQYAVVHGIGAMTDYDWGEWIWWPAQFVSFFLGAFLGFDVIVIGAMISFVIGVWIILKLGNMPLREILGRNKVV
jgi:hypothetical protein